jgi:hypothetical protein
VKRQIENALSTLHTLPLNGLGRASNIVWFTFGAIRNVRDYKGVIREVSKYSLHVQCNWKLILGNTILLASTDIYTPKTGLSGEDEFAFDKHGCTRFDEISPLINLDSRHVTSSKANELGDILLVFDDSFELQVFIDRSSSNEQWRLFAAYSNEKHFVMTGEGIELH